MTQTAFPPPAAEPPPFPSPAPAKKPRKRHRGRTNAIIIAVFALLLVVTVGAAYWYLEREADDLARQAASADTLLAQSEGRVADPATRQELTEQLTGADDVLNGVAFVDRMPGQASAATENLIAASDRVWASMVQRARNDIAEGRDRLEATITRGEKIYRVTEDLDGDELARTALRSALDSAEVAHTRTRDDGLADADLVQLEEAVADLTSRRAELGSTTDSMITAQDAATCPAPDQLWTPDSGRLADQRLAAIPWAPEYRVRTDLLDSLVSLNDAYRARFGTDLTINSAYRSLADQAGLYDPNSPLAAAPGCSTHGLGVAVDFGGGVQTFGTPEHEWMQANAPAHGWLHPRWAAPNGRVPEAWHWQHETSPAETL
ncbi:M15 family metallopeptidase [Myceligenerans pegani]|uniref:D-alanyl-D-alanine carboxypeptidase family protein n=1 Tax=Myceligenerans pegani TaxID=2776917 RepID=A0ABR9MUD9_9MICO|nr:M15 family metallopeptidase [Myceligenerans sp. TRM 65318]MBE1874993.1 D-alanyl-D-alanine carboxypeptidase family protein [Myceligenerans sp. TRM 65318]MBE3017264.1 D-alanyl-D-alanine carboxypeptidase family protein [Myceligenerans sp. TRM 65318]